MKNIMDVKFQFSILFLVLFIIFIGCGCTDTGKSISYGNSWLGMSQTEIVQEEKSLDTKTMIVVAASPIMKQGDKIPVTVNYSSTASTEPVAIAMSSDLGGTFNPENGYTDNGVFPTSYTASETELGLATITAIAGSEIATTSVQVIAKPIMIYTVIVTPAQAIMNINGIQIISVKVVDSMGTLVDGEIVAITSSVGGTFDDGIYENTVKGIAYFKYTAPGAPAMETLTVHSMGTIATATITVQ
ncbi:hypothetical protein KAJ27_13780 [bacterium]|nr:hypothetical protein [bacterium]